MNLQVICQKLIKAAHKIGLKVVREDLDPVEYRKFLEERKLVVDEELRRIEEEKTAKILRTTSSSPAS